MSYRKKYEKLHLINRHYHVDNFTGLLTIARRRAAKERPLNNILELETDIREVEQSRNIYYAVGIAGALGGVGVYFAGLSRNRSAADVPGCSRDGSSVICNTQQGTDKANDRIDEGRNTMLLGALIAVVGSGFIIGGSYKDRKASRLKRKLKRQKVKLGFDIERSPSINLTYQTRF